MDIFGHVARKTSRPNSPESPSHSGESSAEYDSHLVSLFPPRNATAHSSALRIAIVVLALFLCSIPNVVAGGQGVWGLDVDEFQRRVRHGDYEFLRHLNYDDLNLSEIRRLGEGASYYTGRVLARLDMPDAASQLLQLAEREEPAPWSRSAATALVSYLSDREDYQRLERLAGPMRSRYPEETVIVSAYIEALYEQDKHEEVLAALQEESADEILGRPEALLWRGVSAYEADEAGWRDAIETLFRESPASIYQSRVYLFIAARSELQERFSDAELSLFRGKHFLSEGRAADAFAEFRTFVSELEPGPLAVSERRLLSDWTIRDIGVAALSANMLTEGMALLDRVRELAPSAASAAIEEYRGRLALARGSAEEARRLLAAALANADDEYERFRRRRYYLQALVETAPSEAAVAIGGQLSGAESAERYDPVLEELSARLVSERRWGELLAAYRGIRELSLPESISQYAVVLATAARRGLMELPAGIGAESLLAEAAQRRSSPYYALVASAMLGRSPDALLPNGPSSADFEPSTTTERYVTGYFDFGLLEEGYFAARRHRDDLPAEALVSYAERLGDRGEVANSMRLADLLYRSEDLPLSRSLLELRFPHAFHQQLSSVVGEYGLPQWVFYGLVREESYFQPAVGSGAGAIGLTQLMPATANEMAGRLRLGNPDITDPETNLRIGGYYLNYLRDRFEALTPALLAYNAGPTRLRRWTAEFGDLPGLLFSEALPFAETRNYLRKVLVSSFYYGYLYGDASAGETVRLFFPDLPEMEAATQSSF